MHLDADIFFPWPILAHLGPLQTHTVKILEALWIPSTQWVHRATGLAWNQKDLEMICISNHSNPRKLEAFKLPVSSSLPKYHTCLNTWMGDVDQCKHYRESEREEERESYLCGQSGPWNILKYIEHNPSRRPIQNKGQWMCVMFSHFSEAPLLVKTQFQSDLLHLYCNLWKGKGRLLFWKQTSQTRMRNRAVWWDLESSIVAIVTPLVGSCRTDWIDMDRQMALCQAGRVWW